MYKVLSQVWWQYILSQSLGGRGRWIYVCSAWSARDPISKTTNQIRSYNKAREERMPFDNKWLNRIQTFRFFVPSWPILFSYCPCLALESLSSRPSLCPQLCWPALHAEVLCGFQWWLVTQRLSTLVSARRKGVPLWKAGTESPLWLVLVAAVII